MWELFMEIDVNMLTHIFHGQEERIAVLDLAYLFMVSMLLLILKLTTLKSLNKQVHIL